MIDRIVYYWRAWRYREAPLPRIGVRAGLMVPAWLLRLVVAAIVGGCLATTLGRTGATPTAVAIVTIAGFAVTLARTNYAVALGAVILSALFVLASRQAPFDPATVWVAVAAYVGLRLSLAAALLPWTGRAELRALLTWRDAVIVVLTIAVQFARLLPGGGVLAAIIGTAGLVILAIVFQAVHSTTSDSSPTGRRGTSRPPGKRRSN